MSETHCRHYATEQPERNLGVGLLICSLIPSLHTTAIVSLFSGEGSGQETKLLSLAAHTIYTASDDSWGGAWGWGFIPSLYSDDITTAVSLNMECFRIYFINHTSQTHTFFISPSPPTPLPSPFSPPCPLLSLTTGTG